MICLKEMEDQFMIKLPAVKRKMFIFVQGFQYVLEVTQKTCMQINLYQDSFTSFDKYFAQMFCCCFIETSLQSICSLVETKEICLYVSKTSSLFYPIQEPKMQKNLQSSIALKYLRRKINASFFDSYALESRVKRAQLKKNV